MIAEHSRFHVMLFVIGILYAHYVSMESFHDLRRLNDHITEHMDADIRPVLNQFDTLNVDIIPVLTHLKGLDEKNQVLISTFAMQLLWKYETITWNSSEFGEATEVTISSSSVWTPDITYQNSYRENVQIDISKGSKVTISNEGNARWNIGANLQTGCNVDIRKYPFDTQFCKIILGKMIYLDKQVQVKSLTDKMIIKMTELNNEWLIVDTDIKYTNRREFLTYIEILIVLERRYLFYILNVIIPVVMLSMMNVFSFKLPPSGGERIGFSISLLLTYVVLLNMISDSVPRVSMYVSYLQFYIIIQFSIAIIISILSITIVRMENDKCNTNIPQFVMLLFKLFRKDRKNVRKVHVTKKQTDVDMQLGGHKETEIVDKTGAMMKGTTYGEDQTLVQFLDIACFWTFMCCFVISTAVCFLKMIL